MNQEVFGYDDLFISLVELVYGEGLLSQGGESSIDEMFANQNLNGLTALDVGCGLGMYDILIAKKNKIDIIGIDPHPKMIEKANQYLAKYKDQLKGSVRFQKISSSNRLESFQDNSFDLIFSKETILHIPLNEKLSFFKEVYRLLHSPGSLVILDWMHRDVHYSTNTKKMMELDKVRFALTTPEDYEKLLKQAGFCSITYQDTTAAHAVMSDQNIQHIYQIKDQIIKQFGENVFYDSLKSWQYQSEAFQKRELLTGVFRCQKFL